MYKVSVMLLIIDDDEVVCESFVVYLEDSNFKVLQVFNGLQGLQIFESEQLDLVICDLCMLQIDGFELICCICQIVLEMLIIVFFGVGVMSDVVEVLCLGVVDYLIKFLEDFVVFEYLVCWVLDCVYLWVENQCYCDKLEVVNCELQVSLNLFQEDQNVGCQVQMNMFLVMLWSIEGLEFFYWIILLLYFFGDFVDYFWVDE